MPGTTSLGIPYLLGTDAASSMAQTDSAQAQQVNSLINADRGRLTDLERQGLVGEAIPGGTATSGATTTVPTLNSVSVSALTTRVYKVTFGCDISSQTNSRSLALVELIAVQGATVVVVRQTRGGSDGTATSQRESVERTCTWRPATGGAWTLAVRIALSSASGGVTCYNGYILAEDAGAR